MERAKFARVDTLVAALSCPLCFEMVKDCVVTPCGHSFCRTCAGDAINRKHCCPVCQIGVIGGEAGLIRNFLVDEVTSALRKATDDTDSSYMSLLFKSAVEGVGGGMDSKFRLDPRSPHSSLPQPPLENGMYGSPHMDGTNQQQPRQDHHHNRHNNQHHQHQKQPHHEHEQQGVPCPLAPGDFSPIEAVFVKRMREAFLDYQSYYDRERAAHEAEVRDLTTRLLAAQREDMDVERETGLQVTGAGKSGATSVDSSAAKGANMRTRKVVALQGAIEDSRARFKAGMEALLRDFDAHAESAAPPPSLLPSTVTVILASRGVRFITKVLPTDFPENVYGKVRAYYIASGDEVRGFGPDTRLYLQSLSPAKVAGAAMSSSQAWWQQAQAASHPISEATQTVFSQSPGARIGAGWALVVDGKVLLASEEMKPCFADEFSHQQQERRGGKSSASESISQGGQAGPGGADRNELQRMDYFTCGECNLNWLCAACATHCHAECRDVKPFILNHLPTWACCYCRKKRSRLGCKLSAAGAKS